MKKSVTLLAFFMFLLSNSNVNAQQKAIDQTIHTIKNVFKEYGVKVIGEQKCATCLPSFTTESGNIKVTYNSEKKLLIISGLEYTKIAKENYRNWTICNDSNITFTYHLSELNPKWMYSFAYIHVPKGSTKVPLKISNNSCTSLKITDFIKDKHKAKVTFSNALKKLSLLVFSE